MNYDFGKLDENRMMRYAPDSVRVIEHHTAQHEEYDSYDEEGNPVGEPHMVTDEWTTERVVLHPNEDDYRNAKDGPYLSNEKTPSNPPEGQHVAATEWRSDGAKNYRVCTYEEDEPAPAPVYILSKLKCYMALSAMDVEVDGVKTTAWDVVSRWLDENGLKTAFILANEVTTNNPMFEQGFAALKSLLGLTDEQGEDFIKNCIME